MKGWRECKLTDVAERFAMGPFGSNIKAENFIDSGVPVIRGTNLNYYKYVDGDFVFLTEEKADQLKGSNCFPGDLVFTHRGTIGQVGIIPDSKYSRYVISQSGMKVTVNKHLIDNHFLFYFFKSDQGQHELLQHESQVGVPSISSPLTSLKSVSLLLPPLPEQRAIAGVLSSLDDKIDLLHRQNKTLEGLAEALWRKMFVEEADTAWKEVKIGDVITVKGGTTPSSKCPEFWNGDIPWTTPRDLSNQVSVYLFDTERKITAAGLSQIGSGLLPVGSVLLSSRAPIGYLVIADIEVAINQGYIGILCDKGISNNFMFIWIHQNMETIIGAANGSTFLEVSKSVFKDLDFLLPSKDTLAAFDKKAVSLFGKIRNNQIQIRTLSRLRDALLPKLMSGDIKVKS
jgi:type I restriction enzyme S subunit